MLLKSTDFRITETEIYRNFRTTISNIMSSRLDTLPPEILFIILSYAEPSYSPDLVSFPLCTIAATNRYLNRIAEEYARSLLKQHTALKAPQTLGTTCRRRWLTQICQFCKKISKRRAILYPTLTCCARCDRAHIPKMVRLAYTSSISRTLLTARYRQ